MKIIDMAIRTLTDKEVEQYARIQAIVYWKQEKKINRVFGFFLLLLMTFIIINDLTTVGFKPIFIIYITFYVLGLFAIKQSYESFDTIVEKNKSVVYSLIAKTKKV